METPLDDFVRDNWMFLNNMMAKFSQKQIKNDKLNSFSVPLGLLDYINPVLYSVTMSIIIKNLYSVMEKPYSAILLVGAVISVLFGLVIPTGKVIVGLGIIQFRMPVSLVACVNFGIFMSGLMLLKYVLNIPPLALLILVAVSALFLFLIYRQSKKINTVAVLIGAVGYLMIYISLILLSIQKRTVPPVVFYCFAITLFVTLCGIGIKANLKNPKVHWIIEILNVLCQLFVTIGTMILFRQ